jgi:hypothetical protein
MYRALGHCTTPFEVPPPVDVQNAPIEIHLTERAYANLAAPEVWGESFWFVVHLGSVSAPEVIPPEKREKYWNFIDGIPEMLACKKCAVHAREWVEQNRPKKEMITASRKALIQFYVDMHNAVNERNGQPTLSVEEVVRKFTGPVRIRHFQYT